MRTLENSFLRRTVKMAVATLALSGSLPVLAQGVVTLSGVTGNSCSYSSMTVQPNGTIAVVCNGTTNPPPPVDPNVADFRIAGTTNAGAPNSTGTVTITRSGGPADQPIEISHTLSGSCHGGTAPLTFAPNQAIPISYVLLDTVGGVCTISIDVPSPHTRSTPSWSIVIQSTNQPPPTPPTPPGCPTPPLDAVARSLDYGPVDQLRMKSGIIASYPVIPSPDARFVAVDFTQGQQPNTPGSVTTEFSVSKCPGVIDTSVTGCYYKSALGSVNSNKITIFTHPKPDWGWVDQNSVAAWGCLADSSQGQWYVNVRWTYPSCPWGDNNCGFSMQWAIGSW